MAMMSATMPSIRSVLSSLAGLWRRRVLGNRDIGAHAAGHRVAAMGELPRDDQSQARRSVLP